MDTQEQLGIALFNSLIKLRQEKDTFNMADVGALFENISTTFCPDGGIDNSLQEGVKQLAVLISQAKSEISAVSTSDGGMNATGDATQHLDAVIKGTEEASHAIMDATDTIQAAANAIGGEQQQIISDAITKIYEACNFQDLTGQRLNKVIKILGAIDAKISNMLTLFGEEDGQSMRPFAADGKSDDEKLLNGPQLPDQAPSQDDIDALFANGTS